MSVTLVGYGASDLQRCIDTDISLARHLGIVVESADDAAVVLHAPLAPNSNHKGTAFGGSLYCVAVLCGWAWVTRYLKTRAFSADAVIQHSSAQFLAPVHGPLRARAEGPAPADIAKFRRMLERAGRGRIALQVRLEHAGRPAMLFEGVFVAALRRPGERECREN